MDEPRFYTAEGWLTEYALACGYVEKDDNEGVRTTLWAEGGVYHVRQHDGREGAPHGPTHVPGRVFWEVFDGLQEARECYANAITRPGMVPA